MGVEEITGIGQSRIISSGSFGFIAKRKGIFFSGHCIGFSKSGQTETDPHLLSDTYSGS